MSGENKQMMKRMSEIIAVAAISALFLLSACSSKPVRKDALEGEKKTIVIAVTKKPAYPDMITFAIQPVLAEKGYTIVQKELDETRIILGALQDGEIDLVIAGHRAAYDYLEKYTGARVATLITVPSATEGLFAGTVKASGIEELKQGVRKGDVVLMPDDPSNLARSLIFLEKLGFLALKEGIIKGEATEMDIAGNPYGLNFKAMVAAQIPRNLESAAFAVIFGDDADLLDLLDSAITRETSPGEEYLILFGIKPGNEDKTWALDFKEAVLSEEYKNVIEDKKYRFHKYQKPRWYVEKWGIENKY
jgi:D-methionine transport system substrate-binding protein